MTIAETKKYNNGIEVTFIIKEGFSELTQESYPYVVYEISFGASVIRTDSLNKAKEEFNRLCFELAKKKIKEQEYREFLSNEVEKWNKEIQDV